MEVRQSDARNFGGPRETEEAWPVYAIVPAHAGSNAESVARQLSRELSEGFRLSVLLADFCSHGFPLWGVEKPKPRLDGRTWGGFVTRGQSFDMLEAREAHPRNISRLLDHARARYHVTCADLSEAGESAAFEVMRQAEGIFLVADSDAESIEQASYRAAWFRSMNLEDRAGLLLNRVRGGENGAEAEARTGLPVCAVLDGSRGLNQFARWLAPFEELARTTEPGAGARRLGGRAGSVRTAGVQASVVEFRRAG